MTEMKGEENKQGRGKPPIRALASGMRLHPWSQQEHADG